MSLEKNFDQVDLSESFGARVQDDMRSNYNDDVGRETSIKEAQKLDSYIQVNSGMRFKSKNGHKVRASKHVPEQKVVQKHPSECLNQQRVVARSAKLEAIIADRARRMK